MIKKRIQQSHRSGAHVWKHYDSWRGWNTWCSPVFCSCMCSATQSLITDQHVWSWLYKTLCLRSRHRAYSDDTIFGVEGNGARDWGNDRFRQAKTYLKWLTGLNRAGMITEGFLSNWYLALNEHSFLGNTIGQSPRYFSKSSFSFDAFSDIWNFIFMFPFALLVKWTRLWHIFLPTIFHVLCNNIDWLLCNNSEEADETWMLQVLHHVGLCQEGFHWHCAHLQVLNCHSPVVIVDTWKYTHRHHWVSERHWLKPSLKPR